MLNLAKLTKVLMLTQSPVDGEALAALRVANQMLSKEGLNWAQFIDGYIPNDYFRPTNADSEEPVFGKNGRARPKPWKRRPNGNWCRYSDRHQGVCTVFRDSRGWGYKWVCEGKFYGPFSSAESAMADAGSD